jgi:hypothetical protein
LIGFVRDKRLINSDEALAWAGGVVQDSGIEYPKAIVVWPRWMAESSHWMNPVMGEAWKRSVTRNGDSFSYWMEMSDDG